MNVAWGFGPPIDKQAATRVIRRGYELGVTYFDSAEVYGPFLSEELVGGRCRKWRGSNGSAVLASPRTDGAVGRRSGPASA